MTESEYTQPGLQYKLGSRWIFFGILGFIVSTGTSPYTTKTITGIKPYTTKTITGIKPYTTKTITGIKPYTTKTITGIKPYTTKTFTLLLLQVFPLPYLSCKRQVYFSDFLPAAERGR